MTGSDGDIRVVCTNLDRLVTAPLRPLGHPRGEYVPKLYDRARQLSGAPLSYLCAKAILDLPGPRMALVTGTYNPVHFPGGESDGPIGAAVMGRALAQLGCEVTFCVEEQIIPAMKSVAGAAGATGAEYEELIFGQEDGHAHLADRFDGAIFIEKIGQNRLGVHHTSSGMASDTDDSPVGGLVDELGRQGKLTIGLGDGGNEVGFGKIVDLVREIVSYGTECRCSCGGGIATVAATELLFPASISNWAGYAIIAAIALLKDDPSLLHTPEMEKVLLELAPTVGCYEGTLGEGVPGIDSVPVDGSCAMVQLLKSTFEVANRKILPLDTRPY